MKIDPKAHADLAPLGEFRRERPSVWPLGFMPGTVPAAPAGDRRNGPALVAANGSRGSKNRPLPANVDRTARTNLSGEDVEPTDRPGEGQKPGRTNRDGSDTRKHRGPAVPALRYCSRTTIPGCGGRLFRLWQRLVRGPRRPSGDDGIAQGQNWLVRYRSRRRPGEDGPYGSSGPRTELLTDMNANVRGVAATALGNAVPQRGRGRSRPWRDA